MKLQKLIPESSVIQKMKNSIKSEILKFKTKTIASLTSIKIFLLNTEMPSFNFHLIPSITVHQIREIHKNTQALSKNELYTLNYRVRKASPPGLLILGGRHIPFALNICNIHAYTDTAVLAQAFASMLCFLALQQYIRAMSRCFDDIKLLSVLST